MLDAMHDYFLLLPLMYSQGTKLLTMTTQLKISDFRQSQRLLDGLEQSTPGNQTAVGQNICNVIPFQASLKQVAAGEVDADENERQRQEGSVTLNR